MPLTKTVTLDALLHLQTSLSLFLFKKYVFIYLASLGLSYGMRDTPCVHRLTSCGEWAL